MRVLLAQCTFRCIGDKISGAPVALILQSEQKVNLTAATLQSLHRLVTLRNTAPNGSPPSLPRGPGPPPRPRLPGGEERTHPGSSQDTSEMTGSRVTPISQPENTWKVPSRPLVGVGAHPKRLYGATWETRAFRCVTQDSVVSKALPVLVVDLRGGLFEPKSPLHSWDHGNAERKGSRSKEGAGTSCGRTSWSSTFGRRWTHCLAGFAYTVRRDR